MYQCNACGKLSTRDDVCSNCGHVFTTPPPEVKSDLLTSKTKREELGRRIASSPRSKVGVDKTGTSSTTPSSSGPTLGEQAKSLLLRLKPHVDGSVISDYVSRLKSSSNPATVIEEIRKRVEEFESPKPPPKSVSPTVTKELLETAKLHLKRLAELGRTTDVSEFQTRVVDSAKGKSSEGLSTVVDELELKVGFAETQVGRERKRAVDELLESLPPDRQGGFPGRATTLATTKPIDLVAFSQLEGEIKIAIRELEEEANRRKLAVDETLKGLHPDKHGDFGRRAEGVLTSKPIDVNVFTTLEDEINEAIREVEAEAQRRKKAVDDLLRFLPVNEHGDFPSRANAALSMKPINLASFTPIEVEVGKAVEVLRGKATGKAKTIVELIKKLPTDRLADFKGRTSTALKAQPIDLPVFTTIENEVQRAVDQVTTEANEKKNAIVELLKKLTPDRRGDFPDQTKKALGSVPINLAALTRIETETTNAVRDVTLEATRRKDAIDVLLTRLPRDRHGDFPTRAANLLTAVPINPNAFTPLEGEVNEAIREFRVEANRKKSAIDLLLQSLATGLRPDFANRSQTAMRAVPIDLAALVTLETEVGEKIRELEDEANRRKLAIDELLRSLPTDRQLTMPGRATTLHTLRPVDLDAFDELKLDVNLAITQLQTEANSRKLALDNLLTEIATDRHGNLPTRVANVLTGRPIDLSQFDALEEEIRDALDEYRRHLISTGSVDPTVAMRWKNEGVKRAVGKLQDTLRTATDTEKESLADDAREQVTTATPEVLANLSTQDQIELMTKLKCYAPGGVIPGPQMEAIKKLYESSRLDKEFARHDKEKRQEVLQALVQDPVLIRARDTWDSSGGLTVDMQEALEKAQELQCDKLGFTPDVMEFTALSGGSAGKCAGKLVKISTDPDAIKDFTEVIDTLVHETTHAYQYFLVEELDAGRLTVDDPRYSQAWLFKLNAHPAYAEPPTRLTPTEMLDPTLRDNYSREHKVYQRQPTEEHAWKAGSEAGRAFDINAVALQIATLSATIANLVPGKATEANTLREQFETRGTISILETTEIIESLEALAQEAYKVAETNASSLYPSMNLYAVDGFRQYSGEWLTIANSKANIRMKLEQMSTLATTLQRLTDEGLLAKGRFEIAKGVAGGLVPAIGSYVRNGFDTYNRRWLEICNNGESYAQKETAMISLRNELQLLTNEGLLAKERFTTAKDGVSELYPSMGDYVTRGFETYSQRWQTICRSDEVFAGKETAMTRLLEEMRRLRTENQAAVTEYDDVYERAAIQTQDEANEINRINGLDVSKPEKLRQFNSSTRLAAVRQRLQSV